MALPSGPGWIRRLWLIRERDRIATHDELSPGSMVDGIPRADGKAEDQAALEAVIDILMEFTPMERKRIIAATRGFFDDDIACAFGGGRKAHPPTQS